MMRILSVSSSRADVTMLSAVWQAIAAREGWALHLLLTGMHMAPGAPQVATIPAAATVHRGGADLGGGEAGEAAAAMAAITRDAGRVLGEVRPDVVLLAGDRLDMIPAALAALPANIPLAHLHGGEITEGAVDDRVRHALTKLAHIHLVSSPGAAARVAAMGEERWRIRVTGAPALDTLLAAPVMGRADFLQAIGFGGGDGRALRLVTVHPETNAQDPLAPLNAVLAALDARPAPTLFTAPNSDPGGAEMRRRIETFCAARPWARLVDTLGPRLYPNALRHAALMLGNSSSGIIEAGLFALPVINVGDRQGGRERGDNVIDVPNNERAVVRALREREASPERFAAYSPYGDGRAAPRVAEVLATLPERATLLRKPLVCRTERVDA